MRASSESVKQFVRMDDLLSVFGISYNGNRIKCPLHGGDGLNFRIKNNMFTCFSQCGSGDIFQFVQLMRGCDFKTALDWLCEQFGIPNDDTCTPEQRAEADRINCERLQARLERDQAVKRGKYTHDRLCAYLRYLKAQKKTAESGMIGYLECILDEYADRNGMERLGKVMPDVDKWIREWRRHWNNEESCG